MFDLVDINSQIQSVTDIVNKLLEEKSDAEKRRNETEETLEEFTSAAKSIIEGIGRFDNILHDRTGSIQGNFGMIYRDRMNEALKKGGARDVETQKNDINSSLRKAVLSLDDVIEDLARKIFENNELLQSLKQMALQVAETVEDIVEG